MLTESDALEQAWALHPELLLVDFDEEERTKGINWHVHLTFDAMVLRRISDPVNHSRLFVKTTNRSAAF